MRVDARLSDEFKDFRRRGSMVRITTMFGTVWTLYFFNIRTENANKFVGVC